MVIANLSFWREWFFVHASDLLFHTFAVFIHAIGLLNHAPDLVTVQRAEYADQCAGLSYSALDLDLVTVQRSEYADPRAE